MSKLSNEIEKYIIKLLIEKNGELEIQRSFIAKYFDCSPSQINYVLSTRFTPYKGFFIDSKRGEGGYIKIIQVSFNNNIQTIFFNEICNSITKNKSDLLIDELFKENLINDRERKIIKATVSDSALNSSKNFKNEIRANILKNILLILFK